MSVLSVVHGSVLNIGGEDIDVYLRNRIYLCLVDAHKSSQLPYLPEELLYLGKGLNLWRTLVFNPKYYQTHDEIKLFYKNGEHIISHLPPNCTLIDLGSGNTQKVETLLSVLEKRGEPVVYLALDINREYLTHNISALANKYSKVVCQGVYGTYDDAISWCTKLSSPRAFLWLGSTLFRGTRDEALASLRSWAKVLQHGDVMIVGADGHTAPEYYDKIWDSYHSDNEGWQKLWDNGFAVANDVIGEKWFHSADWKLDAVIDNGPIGRHQFKFRAQRDLVLGSSGIVFRKGEEFVWLEPHKFSKVAVHDLCHLAGLQVVETWQAEDSEMYQYLIRRSLEHDKEATRTC